MQAEERGRDDDPRINEIVSDYVDRMNAGERITAELVLREEPLLGSEILDALQVFFDLDPKLEEQSLGTLGDYTLRRQIGRGGMGVVYEAWQNSMDRRVALKVMPKAVAVDTKAVGRFIQEAQLAGKLSHPNIVHVHGMGVEQQVPYYAMDFVEGETLAQIAVKLKQQPDAQTPFGRTRDDQEFYLGVARCFGDVAEGLQHAHSKKVIHRDIKPSNLILDREGRLRILDFGLAHLEGQESLTLSGDFVGTPQYMSPEQARRKKIEVDHRTDLYSLGATLYEMLTGKPPFRGKDHQDTLTQIIERDPVEPRRLNARVPRDLETIVLKCLRKEAGDRYGTAEALAQDLRRFVRGDAIEARPEGALRKLGRMARRYRVPLLAGVVFITLLAVIGWLTLRDAHEKRLRALANYKPTVLRALEKLQAGSLSLKAESGQPLATDPRRWVFGRGELEGLPKTLMEPVEEALRELDNAISTVPETPDAWFHRAHGHLLLGNLDGALRDLDRSLRSAPAFVPALILQAAILERRGENDAARALREKAQAVDGKWQGAWLLAHQALREKRWDDAAGAFGELIQLGAEGKEPYLGAAIESCLGRAGAKLEVKDPTGALQDIAVARYLWPTSVEAALLEGKAYYLMGNPEKTEQVFEKMYEQAPLKDEVAIAVETIYLYFHAEDRGLKWAERVRTESIRERYRSECLLEMGRCEEAVHAAKRAIALDPDFAMAHVVLALALYDCQGKFEEALGHLEAARDTTPQSAYCYFHLGRFFRIWGKLDQATEHYRKATKLDPSYSIAHADLSVCVLLQGKTEDGLRILDAAVEMDPWNPYVYNDKAYALEFLGRHPEVLKTCDAASRLSPEFAWPYARRGQVLEKEGKFEEATNEYRKACPLTPREVGNYHRLGGLLDSLGEHQEAMATYLDAAKLDPANALTHCRIALLLNKHGLAVAGQAERLRALLDEALERVLRDLDETELVGGRTERFVLSLVWILSSLQAVGSRGESLIELLPRLPPYAAIDALLDFEKIPWPDTCRRILAKVLAAGATAAAASRGKYLEAKLLERCGKPREAAAKFSELIIIEPTSPQLALALAVSLRPDDPAGAEVELRKALATTSSGGKNLWDLWATICLKDLQRDPANLLADFPASSKAAAALGEDLRWLLEHLRDGVAIRINCGGEDYVSPDGTAWSPDRFFTDGWATKPYLGEIAGTDSDPLYRSQRCFPEELVSAGGYRLPVPPGRYRIALHFAEVYWRIPGARRCDIVIEGQEILDGHDPIAARFAAASVQSFVMSVNDGCFDLEFIQVADLPTVSAIEIERVE